MNKKEILLQEKWFELYSSEFNYLNNMNLLVHFIMEKFKKCLNEYEINLLFPREIFVFLKKSIM
jgi:hypothetical protein